MHETNWVQWSVSKWKIVAVARVFCSTSRRTLDKGEHAIEKVTKEQDVKYKNKKAAGMNKTVFLLFWSTAKRFRMSENDIPAVLEYLKKIEHE